MPPSVQVTLQGRRSNALPSQVLRCPLGSADGCAVRLDDPHVLPVHAQLTRERERWLIRALGNGAGLWRDGARRRRPVRWLYANPARTAGRPREPTDSIELGPGWGR